MKMRKYLSITMIMMTVAILPACDDALDINDDPNNPSQSNPQLVLPVAEVSIAATIEGEYNILGSMLAQYWTGGPTAPQFNNIDKYNITTNDYSTVWSFWYATVLSDLEFTKTAALEGGFDNHAAVAIFLQAYTYQVLADLYDQIPFSEALQGKKTGNVAPAFDDGDDVYDGLIAMIDEGLALISLNAPVPGKEELIYGGNMDLWTKFANTLKLKIYIRQAMARPSVAQAGIEDLYTNGASFLSPGEDAKITFSANTHNENPLWQELNQTSFENLVASETSIDTLLQTGDTRIKHLYDTAEATNTFVGLTQGVGTQDGGLFDDYSGVNSTEIISSTAPVYLMTGYESLFMQAEAAQRGWSSEDDAALYNEAVLASFSFWGEDGASFIAPAGVYEYDGQLETIFYQKWLAFNGKQGMEGWNEWRRTGVPTLPVSAQGISLPNTYPLRLIFPNSERSTNPNTPALQTLDTPVWWDTTF